MTPKEELIQAIQRSPHEVVVELLKVLHTLEPQHKLSTDALEPGQTVLERMGGVPKHLLSDGNLSARDRRRAVILNRLQQKRQVQE
jgi:hypothetical protein